jgi:hypothetical protein
MLQVLTVENALMSVLQNLPNNFFLTVIYSPTSGALRPIKFNAVSAAVFSITLTSCCEGSVAR